MVGGDYAEYPTKDLSQKSVGMVRQYVNRTSKSVRDAYIFSVKVSAEKTGVGVWCIDRPTKNKRIAP